MSYEYKQFYRRKLPHINPPGAILFVTFRLAGSVPKAVLEQWRCEKQWLEHELKRVAKDVRQAASLSPGDAASLSPGEAAGWQPAVLLNHQARLTAFHRRWFARFEEVLHRAAEGPTWLKDERVAKLVADSLAYRDGKVYRLDAYCIMSNHVHVVCKPFLDEKSLAIKAEAEGSGYQSSEPPLAVIMHSLKSYTANEANKILKRSGAFWETESYDHVIKDAEEYHRVVAYVLNNPVKAGLVKDWREWPWTWRRQ